MKREDISLHISMGRMMNARWVGDTITEQGGKVLSSWDGQGGPLGGGELRLRKEEDYQDDRHFR